MEDLSAVMPWHRDALARLVANRERLAHALLLHGPEGTGKYRFALGLAARLLCLQPREAGTVPCGECPSCRLLSAGSHPDLHLVVPENIGLHLDPVQAAYAARYLPERKPGRKTESTVIAIDQVRALIQALATRAHTAPHKVALFWPAERLNTSAANALLKLLEEPPQDSILLLVSNEPHRLPATVRSRCVKVPLALPAEEAALEWLAARGLAPAPARQALALAGGAPLRAEQLFRSDFPRQSAALVADLARLASGQADPTECAARWQKAGAYDALDWFARCLADLACLASTETPARLFNGREELKSLAEPLDLVRLLDLWERVCRARQFAGTPLDSQLMLEDLLIDWMQGARRRGTTSHAR